MQINNSFKYIAEFNKKVIQMEPHYFDELAHELYTFQYKNNPIYKSFCNSAKQIGDFHYLPISAFKSHVVKAIDFTAEAIFESSGTTGQINSQHHVPSVEFYHELATGIFTNQVGAFKNTIILGLLPSYLERQNSSLVSMVNHFIHLSGHYKSGFYLYNYEALTQILIENKDQKIVLFGVSFALIDFVEELTDELHLPHLTVIETGGMKGRKKEITREELHATLASKLPNSHISSEYGMTELLSQAYMDKAGWFHCPPSMRVSVVEVNDPFSIERFCRIGVLQVIDLANAHSCAFIATEDLGVVREDGAFRVLGRLDNSDMRGCNLMVS